MESKYGYLVINGEFFEADSKDGKTIFKKINKREIKKLEKMSEKIAEHLKDALDKKKVLRESVMKMGSKEIETLHNMLFPKKGKKPRKYKAKTREDRCVDMKVGNFIIPIVP